MTRLVVDASIAMKWVVEEEGTEDALVLRRRAVAAPDLLVPECANILWKKVRLGELSAEEAMIAARLLARSDVELIGTRALLEPATQLAVELDHPAYDCIYVALAEALDTRFVTADDRFARKLRQAKRVRQAARIATLTEVAAELRR